MSTAKQRIKNFFKAKNKTLYQRVMGLYPDAKPPAGLVIGGVYHKVNKDGSFKLKKGMRFR